MNAVKNKSETNNFWHFRERGRKRSIKRSKKHTPNANGRQRERAAARTHNAHTVSPANSFQPTWYLDVVRIEQTTEQIMIIGWQCRKDSQCSILC